MNHNYIAIIPARYASTRFPGKPLALLGGREVILHVVEGVRKAQIYPIVATDDSRIADCVRSAGYEAIMTRADHCCGTDRVREAYEKWKQTHPGDDSRDVIINVQGDEPFIRPEQLHELVETFENRESAQIATLACPVTSGTPYAVVSDPNVVKVVTDVHGNAIYFSRFPIPYFRGKEQEEWTSSFTYRFHIGVYAYRGDILRQITELQPLPIEKAESLEQLRWLGSGYVIAVADTDRKTIGIDTPEDLAAAEKFLAAL